MRHTFIFFLLTACACLKSAGVFAQTELSAHPTWNQRQYLGKFEKIDHACKQKFTAPHLPAPNASCSHNEKNFSLEGRKKNAIETETAAFQSYENQFFGLVRDEQKRQSSCAEKYISIFDQDKLSVPSKECHSGISESLRARVRSRTAIDFKVAKFQAVALRDIFRAIGPTCKEESDRDYNRLWLRHAQDEVAMIKNAGSGFSTLGKKFDIARAEESKAKKYLAQSETNLAALQASVWSGSDSVVQDFVHSNCNTRLSEDAFVKHAIDPNNFDSFQNAVINRLKNKNACRISSLEASGNPVSDNAKIDLVNSGAAITEINSLSRSKEDFRDFACYIQAIYGSGRTQMIINRETAITPFLLVPVIGEVLADGEVTAGTIGGVIIASQAIALAGNGICTFSGSGLSSVISPRICESIEHAKSIRDYAQIISFDLQKRSSCVVSIGKEAAIAAVGMGVGQIIKTVFAESELATTFDSAAESARLERNVAQMETKVISIAKKSGNTVSVEAYASVQKIIRNTMVDLRHEMGAVSDSELEELMETWFKKQLTAGKKLPGLDVDEAKTILNWKQITEKCGPTVTCKNFVDIYRNITVETTFSRYVFESHITSPEVLQASTESLKHRLYDQALLQAYAERHGTSLGLQNTMDVAGKTVMDQVIKEREYAEHF